jgi:hypothetical protein
MRCASEGESDISGKQKTFLPAVIMSVSVFADKKKPLSDIMLWDEYITKHP